MKNRIIPFVIGIVSCCVSLAQQETITVGQVFNTDTTLALFNTRTQISKLAVNISLTKRSPKFFARIVLEDQNHRTYLVGESYREIADESTSFLFDCAEETEHLNGIVPYRLRIYVQDASVELNSIDIINGIPERGRNEENYRVEKIQEKVNKINAYNNHHQKLWSAGVTELSKLPFEDRMRVLGFDVSDNTGGFEYYIGGIFEVGDREDYVPNRSDSIQFVDEFDWTDRHGKNWMTSIKGQGYSNYCAAFTGVACLEALVNLYYNRKIDLNLSEQETACCCFDEYDRNPYKDGLLSSWVAKYFYNNGVCDEDSYPFEDNENDTLCRSSQLLLEKNVRSNGYWACAENNKTDSIIKSLLIQNGPLMSGFWVGRDSTNNLKRRSHAMALVGFKKICAGDTIREVIGTGSNSTYTQYYIIPENSPLIGRTYYKFKNSNNIRPNDDIKGYMHLMFHNNSQFFEPICLLYPFTITDCQTNQPIFTNNDIVCEDADGDGYYFWGLGQKPSHCPSGVPITPDGDDSDPTVGPMDIYGNLTVLTNEIVISSLVNYNTVRNFTHNIRITNGGHLRITNTTTLRNAAQIIVENGGILTIDGGTLKNARITFNAGSTLNIQNNGTIKKAAGQDFVVPIGTIVNAPYGNIL